jgi:branched-chain amino acid transport system permease protein
LDVADLFVQALSGLSRGMILFLLASGLSLIFGALRVLNFAHGSFYMISAYLVYALVSTLESSSALSFWVALAVAPIALGVLGGLVEFAFFRRIYSRELEYQLLLTYGLVLIFSDVVRFIWGEEYRSVSRPAALAGPVFLLDKPVPAYILFLIAMSALIGVGLWVLLFRTKLGRTIRAVVHDRHMVSALGINVPKLYSLVFGLGCWLAGLAGGADGADGFSHARHGLNSDHDSATKNEPPGGIPPARIPARERLRQPRGEVSETESLDGQPGVF